MTTDVYTFEDAVTETLDIDVREARRAAEAAKQKREQAQREKDFIHVMSTFEGRRFVWALCLPIWRISYVGVRSDTDFREGERNVALRVWAQLLEFCPTLAHKMQEENQS